MENEARESTAPEVGQPAYDPPRVEHVIGRDELLREIQYAGTIDPSRRVG